MGAALDSVSLIGDDGVRHPGAPISSLVRLARCRVLDTLSPPPPRPPPGASPLALPSAKEHFPFPVGPTSTSSCSVVNTSTGKPTMLCVPPTPAPSAELSWGSCQSLPPPRPRGPDSPPWDLL